MIGFFLRWWAAQLLDLLPKQLFRSDPARSGALLIEPVGGELRILRRRGAAELPLGTFTLPVEADGPDDPILLRALRDRDAEGDREPVLLRLPADAALHRQVFLPLAAEAGLEQVLSFEMDRLTPFGTEDTFFTWSVLNRDREAGRLQLRLWVVLRRPILPVLELLRRAGRAAAAIEVAPGGTAGNAEPGALIPLGGERNADRGGRLLLRGAVIACMLLAATAVVLPFVLQAQAEARLDRRIAALNGRVAAVQAIERRINGSSAGAELVENERRRLGDPLEVLAAVTQVLPDDTFLTDLTLRRGQLTISGQSASAAKLIPAIGADPHFSAPSFSAPVTRIEGQNTDLFSIRTGLGR